MARFIVVLLGLLANALGIDADVSQWGELGVATLFVWGSVELLRMSVFKSVDGIGVHALAAGVGISLGVLFGLGEIVSGGVFEWIVFGVQATFAATIGDILLKKGTAGKAQAQLVE